LEAAWVPATIGCIEAETIGLKGRVAPDSAAAGEFPLAAHLVDLIGTSYAEGERSTTLTLYRSRKSAEPSRRESRAQ
jgi:hypothetical protein